MFPGDILSYASRAFALGSMMTQPGSVAKETAAADAPHWALEQILWDPDEMTAEAVPVPPPGGAPPLLPAPLGLRPRARAAAAKVTPPPPARTTLRGAPLGCQVSGCATPWSAFRSYNQRARLCEEHMRADSFTLGGEAQRFCQKCNRSHSLEAFEGGKRACKAQLEAFNARRRARYAARKAAPTSAGPAGGSDSGSQDPSSAATGSASAAAAAAAAAARVDTQLLAALLGSEGEALLSSSLLLMPPEDFGSSMLGAGEEIQSAASAAAAGAAAAGWAPIAEAYPGANAWWPLLGVQLATLDVKLEGPGSAPTALPPGLRGMAASLFDSEPLAMHAAVAPGCTLLSLEALMPSEASAGAPGADVALRRLLAASKAGKEGGVVAAHLSALDQVTVTAAGRAARARRGAVQPAPAAAAAARLPPLSALAASCDEAASLSAPLPPGAPAPELRCRVHGRFLAVTARVEGGRLLLELPRAGEAGVALLEHAAGAATSRARPLLLCRDAAVVAELNAAAAACASGPAREAAEQAAILIGYALRPGAAAAVAGRAAAAALRLRWPAAAARCLDVLAACEDDAEAGAACGWLLHEAAAASPEAVRLVLAARDGAAQPALFGAAGRSDGFAGGATPLHVAARLSRGKAAAAAAEALTRCADDAGADALLAWFCARDVDGTTPDAAAAARRDGALAPLAARLRARLADGRAAALRAAAAAQEQHGAFHWPHLAALAEEALPEAPPSADASAAAADAADTRRVASALLRQLASAADAAPAAPMPPSAVARAADAAAEAAFRLDACAPALEIWVAYHAVYCVTLLLRALPRPDLATLRVEPAPEWSPPHGSLPVERVQSWSGGFALMDWVAPVSFGYQVGATIALIVALHTRRGWLQLAKRLQLMLVLQCVAHSLACTLHYSWVVSAVVFAARGTTLVWPARLGVCMTLFTLFMAACLPLKLRYAVPLLGLRGALPVLVSAFPATFYRFWPLGSMGVALLQAGASGASIAYMAWRDRALSARYVAHRAMLEARKQKQA